MTCSLKPTSLACFRQGVSEPKLKGLDILIGNSIHKIYYDNLAIILNTAVPYLQNVILKCCDHFCHNAPHKITSLPVVL